MAELNAREGSHSWPVSSPIAEQIQFNFQHTYPRAAGKCQQGRAEVTRAPPALTQEQPHPFRWTRIWQEVSWSGGAWNAGWASHLQQGGKKEISFGLKSAMEQNISIVRQLSWDYRFADDNDLVLLEGTACLSAPSIPCILCRPGNIFVCTVTQHPAWLGLLG